MSAVASMAADAVPAAAADPSGTGLITTVAGAFARWPHLTDDNEQVHLEGVVTGTTPTGAFRLDDGELGIFVTKSAGGQELTPGDRVALSGVLRRGGFSPWVTPREIVPLGRGVFPQARAASYALLASGAADNQWLEVEGVVRAVDALESWDLVALDLGIEGGTLRVLVNKSQGPPPADLIDAEVRMRGVAAVNVNKHGHVVEPSFRVPSFAEITVTRPPQADAFALPIVPISGLMRVSPGAPHQHRVRTQGVVTRPLSNGVFYLRDGGLGLKVEMTGPAAFEAGDTVDVTGFPEMWQGMAVLKHAVARKIASGTPPAPAQPSFDALFDGAHNCDLVSVRARLVDSVTAGRNITLVFQAGDHLFKGLLTVEGDGRPQLPEKNSLVQVTGICVISELEDVWFYQPRSFLLLVAAVGDLQLLTAPPWWTPARLWWALVITCGVLLAAAGWVWSLRRQIERKRAVIEQQARHAAALEERSRIARELHDTLEQGLTGLSLQMKAMETDLGSGEHPVQPRLQVARQMLRQSRALARNAIRELRADAVPGRLEGLVEGLRRTANLWNHSGALTIDLQVLGQARPLPPRVEHHLLGIGSEAITNAVKHGRADAIRVELDFRGPEVALRVKDNGAGFEPVEALDQSSGCFGLLGMRERAREVRGRLQINSQPGHGAEVIVTAPWSGAGALPV